MKPRTTRFALKALLGMLLTVAMLSWGAALAEETGNETVLPPLFAGLEWRWTEHDGVSASVKAQMAEGSAYLFLPACADESRVTLDFQEQELTLEGPTGVQIRAVSGEAFDLSALFPGEKPEDGVYILRVSNAGGDAAELRVMCSAQQAAIWLFSADPVSHGREWVDSAEVEAKLETTGTMTMADENGDVVYRGGLRQLRGRGNTTWSHYPKKPYQIKLEEKTDLLGGSEDNTSRTWVLLAEAYDGTLLHNTISLAVSAAMGLEGTPECRPVDLYYDGEYRGYYLLCEKVQVGENRLNIPDYGKELEEATPGLDDRERYPLAEAQNDYGNAFRYVEGLESGEDRAFLIELDKFSYRGDDCWFVTYDSSTGLENPFAFKDPEAVSMEDAAEVGALMQELVDCAVNGGVNPITGMTLEEYVDLDALARYLLVHELVKTIDLGETSVYFYRNGDDERFYPGPVWDFDISCGVRDRMGLEAAAADYVPYKGWMREMMRVPYLQERMRNVYFGEVEPLVRDVLLGDRKAVSGGLHSLDFYQEKVRAAYRMNQKLWKRETTDVFFPTQEENMAYLQAYLTERLAWLNQDMELWFGEQIDKVGLSYVPGADGTPGTAEAANPFPHYSIEGVEESGGAYSAVLIADEGIAFGEEATATVNGEDAEVTEQDGGSCRIVWAKKAE